MAVIDASVYVALINAHEGAHARCWAWFEGAKADQEPVVAPVILLAEVAAALSRGTGDPGLAHRVLEQLKRSDVIELLPVTPALAQRAAAIAADHRVRGCDAVYIALADQLGQTLVTLGRGQLERGVGLVSAHEPKS
jgi:predicted nucleic acid-binding protein